MLIIGSFQSLEQDNLKPVKLKHHFLDNKCLQTFINLPRTASSEQTAEILERLGYPSMREFKKDYSDLIALLKRIQSCESLLRMVLKQYSVYSLDHLLELHQHDEPKHEKLLNKI